MSQGGLAGGGMGGVLQGAVQDAGLTANLWQVRVHDPLVTVMHLLLLSHATLLFSTIVFDLFFYSSHQSSGQCIKQNACSAL